MQEIDVNVVKNACPLSPKFVESDVWGMNFTNSIPEELMVTGRVGYNATMNGRYRRSFEHQGRVHFQHTHGKFVIRWSPAKGNWLLDWRGLKTDTTCSAVLLENVESPHMATTRWRVFNGKEWVIDMDLKIENATECLKAHGIKDPETEIELMVGGNNEIEI